MKDIVLPPMGEDVNSGTCVGILVKVGDKVEKDQPLIEVETDKVTAEVPAEIEGIITEILVKEGAEISVGAVIMKIDATASTGPDTSTSIEESPQVTVPVASETVESEAPTANGAMTATAVLTPTMAPASVPVAQPTFTPSKNGNKGKFRASPLARKMAREIGVDINLITEAAYHNRITVQDVKSYAKNQLSQANSGVQKSTIKLPDFSRWGPVSKTTLSGISKATSKNMTTAWSHIPHAWLQEKADITDLEKTRKKYKEEIKALGGQLTITSVLVKLVAKALSKYQVFNASFDEQTNELIEKDYYNIGVAVDTPAGLVVPVIKDADKKTLTEISIELKELSIKARERKLKADDVESGTFTISNLGGIGTTSIFPIVNHPQAAILGVASSKIEAIYNGESFEPKLIMPMTIGFDHRIINGADAARFLQFLKKGLEDWFYLSI